MTKNERNAQDKIWLKENGICIDCRRKNAEPNRAKCWDCLEKDRLRAEKKRKNPEYVTNKKELNKIYYKNAEQSGICVRCHKKKAEDGYKTCKECRLKMKKAKRIRDREKGHMPEDMRNWENICSVCFMIKEYNGHKVCDKCYNRLLKHNAELNSRPRTEKQIQYKERFIQENKAIFQKQNSRS